MRKVDYSYQTVAAQDILSNVLSNKYIAGVLAACPGSGKTTISHIIINEYIRLNPGARVVVLTEGQTVLRSQYLSELDDANVPINFTYGPINSVAQVRVGIPQNIDKLDWSQIDLLVVDEAHNFYLEPMVQSIIADLKPKHQVLMTGSPTKFNELNRYDTKYFMHYIPAEELEEMGVFSAVDIDIVRTHKDRPMVAIKDVLFDAEKKGDNLSKIMVACSTIRDAELVGRYLKAIGRNPIVSTSENDADSSNIAAFRAGKYDVLIVVGRGILGFNDPMITLLVDLRSSSNIDASYQLFARVLRKHPDDVRKAYYRVSNPDTKSYNKEVINCQKMIALMKRYVYTKYNGKNLYIDIEVV